MSRVSRAALTTRLQWLVLQLERRLWIRAGAFSVLGVATALASAWIEGYIPADMPAKIVADAADNILNILAASMLSVTIFSLSTVVAALGSATRNASPRATRLLTGDRIAQNALATFLGSFLFALVGIVALQAGFYGERGRVVLFVVTIAVIAAIVVTLLRWIDHVSWLGRVDETTDRVEAAAAAALRARHAEPWLGGVPFEPGDPLPAVTTPVYAARMGYVEHIDMDALSRLGDGRAVVYVTALPGAYVDPTRPLAHVAGEQDAAACGRVRQAFSVGTLRSFDQDPRFGVLVLAEIASRALSPGTRDAGTPIDVIGRGCRLLATWAEPVEREAPPYPNIHVPPVLLGDLVADLFDPIARDGAALVEVVLRLQRGLHTLASLGDAALARHAGRCALRALAHAEAALVLDDDRGRVREAAAWAAAHAGTC